MEHGEREYKTGRPEAGRVARSEAQPSISVPAYEDPLDDHQVVAAGRFVSLAELAASLAHELNNPLGIIVGFAETLLAKIDASHPHAEPLRIIAEEGRRCSNFVTDLLAFAEPSDIRPVPTDLSAAVRKRLAVMTPQLEKEAIALKLALPPELPLVSVDPQQVEHVLHNVLTNAIEAMAGGGTLDVGAEVVAPTQKQSPQVSLQTVIVRVSDTGPGLEDAELQQVFRPLFTKKTKKGMGLGLSICQALMRANGGTITIHSTPGQGTTVCLSFSIPTTVKG